MQAHEKSDFHQADSTTEPLYDDTRVLVRAAANIVKGLLCQDFGAVLHVIRVIDRRLGFVAVMEIFCTECDSVINSTLSSDRIEGSTSGIEPFFTEWYAVAGSIDMGMGHSGLLKLCRFLDMASVHHKTLARNLRRRSIFHHRRTRYFDKRKFREHGRKRDFRDFTIEVIHQLVEENRFRSKKRGRSSTAVDPPARITDTTHMPVKGEGKDHVCVVCSEKHNRYKHIHPGSTVKPPKRLDL